MSYSKSDVQFHSDGFREGRPAVNVKVYGTLERAFPEFVRDERPDARFTLDWIEEHLGDDGYSNYFQFACESEYEYLESWATGKDDDGLFPDHSVRLKVEGRSGGWVAVDGLPELEDWDAILLARWRKFERIAREIADGIPYQMLSLIYINLFEWWADQEEDAGSSNSELPVDLALSAG